ncbi:MAG: Mov34/MPN/PAD-1 family protein [Acidobacteriia bacterium]|nr:Mov34/MPN/PAD-1 family protein [Terriglobia bacterium]
MRKSLSRVWIHDVVVAGIREDADHYYPAESGGILLGYISDREAVITAFVDGGPRAIRLRDGFIPDQEYHVDSIARVYRDSGYQTTYLGDWHSHPDGPLALSWRDRRTLRRIAGYREARLPTPVLIIIGGSNDWSIAAWTVYSKSCSIIRQYPNLPIRTFP